MSFPMGGRPEGHRFPEASGSFAVRVPERLTERYCSFGARGWRPRNSPAQERCGTEFTHLSRPEWPPGADVLRSADLAVAVFAPRRQLVFGCGDRLAAVGAFPGEIRDCAGQLAHRSGD